jgi:hypothetical protein
LGPVSRAAAFFAFLLFSLLTTSCEKKVSHQGLMKEQAGIYQEMALILQKMSLDDQINEGEGKLKGLITAFQANRSTLAGLPKPNEEDQLKLAALPELSEAHKVFFEAQSAFFSSEHSSPKISNILSGLHEPTAVAGEGGP